LLEPDLRANAFGVYCEGGLVSTLADHARVPRFVRNLKNRVPEA